MPLRVTALFLAFVLLCFGLDAFAVPGAMEQASAGHTQGTVQPSSAAAAHEGLADLHHPGDLPSPAHGDSPVEASWLLPAPPTPGVPPAVMARPHPCASAEAGAPFLAGPLRPPCTAHRAG